nr:MAG TPA: hypothetical protein [Caudoviricetes sp.]
MATRSGAITNTLFTSPLMIKFLIAVSVTIVLSAETHI